MTILILIICAALLSGCAPAPPKDPEAQKQRNVIPSPVVITTPPPEIASYTTKILDKAPERLNNLRLAASEVNGIILNPGDEFSFNETLGRRTKEKGYLMARIIINGKKGYGVGGGVCQISSTIHGAVKAAGLMVTERHEHDKPVGYIAREDEAAVSYGGLDFKFVNIFDFPIMLEVMVSEEEVRAAIRRGGT